MADSSDAEMALVQTVINALYPSGQSQPSVTGSPLRVYRGWPLPGPLGEDLSSNVSNISVFSIANDSRDTTRWFTTPQIAPGEVTLEVRVSDLSVSFEGQAGAGQVAGIIVDDQAFVYRGAVGDTPALVAAVLAESIAKIRTCRLSGNTLTVPGAYRLAARVVADGVTSSEMTRQEQGFRVSVWCPNPSARDQICRCLVETFASIAFLPLTDGSVGRVRYRSSATVDDKQEAGQYRRDLIYDVEYGTFVHLSSPTMLLGDLMWSGQPIFV